MLRIHANNQKKTERKKDISQNKTFVHLYISISIYECGAFLENCGASFNMESLLKIPRY